jgi:hypothetical protein
MLLEVQYAHVLSDTICPVANTNTNSMGTECISVQISGNNCIHMFSIDTKEFVILLKCTLYLRCNLKVHDVQFSEVPEEAI